MTENATYPERIEEYYTVRVFDTIRMRWYRTKWKMTRQAAACFFEGSVYEVLDWTREERIIGGDPLRNLTSAFLCS